MPVWYVVFYEQKKNFKISILVQSIAKLFILTQLPQESILVHDKTKSPNIDSNKKIKKNLKSSKSKYKNETFLLVTLIF